MGARMASAIGAARLKSPSGEAETEDSLARLSLRSLGYPLSRLRDFRRLLGSQARYDQAESASLTFADFDFGADGIVHDKHERASGGRSDLLDPA
jgi:hypothetical protein